MRDVSTLYLGKTWKNACCPNPESVCFSGHFICFFPYKESFVTHFSVIVMECKRRDVDISFHSRLSFQQINPSLWLIELNMSNICRKINSVLVPLFFLTSVQAKKKYRRRNKLKWPLLAFQSCFSQTSMLVFQDLITRSECVKVMRYDLSVIRSKILYRFSFAFI